MQIRRGRDGGLKMHASTTGAIAVQRIFRLGEIQLGVVGRHSHARRQALWRHMRLGACSASSIPAEDPAGCAPLGCGDCVGHVDGPPGAIG